LLWGDVGTGKTFLAGCIANALMERNIPVLMTSLPKLLNALGGIYSGERNEYLQSLNRYRLLIIDDLGVERDTPYVLEMVYFVIDERYKSGKLFIITTNLSLQKLKELKAEYQVILERLDGLEQQGVIGAFDKRTIIELSGDVIKEIAQKYKNVQEGVGDMMSGALIETSARRIKMKQKRKQHLGC